MFAFCICSLVKYLFISFVHSMTELSFNCWVWTFFIHSRYIKYVVYKHFLLLCSLHDQPFNRLFHKGKFLILMKFNLSIFPFMDHAFGVKSKNILPTAWFYRLSLIFFLKKGCIVLCFRFKSLVHFKIIVMYGVRLTLRVICCL